MLFVCLIALAVLGIGISGGVPLPFSNNRRDNEKDKTELLEKQEAKKKGNQEKT